MADRLSLQVGAAKVSTNSSKCVGENNRMLVVAVMILRDAFPRLYSSIWMGATEPIHSAWSPQGTTERAILSSDDYDL